MVPSLAVAARAAVYSAWRPVVLHEVAESEDRS